MSKRDLYIKAKSPSNPQEGISYFDPNRAAHPIQSYADYDDGWRVLNNQFYVTNPEFPLYEQRLDPTDHTKLMFPNIWGNYERYTRLDGSLTPPTAGVVVRDHLTKRDWVNINLLSTSWEQNLINAFSNGFFLPSREEFFSVRANNVTNAIVMMGVNMHVGGQGQRFGTTNPSNITQSFLSNNTQNSFASVLKSTNRPTGILCRIGS